MWGRARSAHIWKCGENFVGEIVTSNCSNPLPYHILTTPKIPYSKTPIPYAKHLLQNTYPIQILSTPTSPQQRSALPPTTNAKNSQPTPQFIHPRVFLQTHLHYPLTTYPISTLFHFLPQYNVFNWVTIS